MRMRTQSDQIKQLELPNLKGEALTTAPVYSHQFLGRLEHTCGIGAQ